MAKLKKYEQVEMFLSDLLEQEGFGLKELEALTCKDIAEAKALEGIGDRTISNALIAFKEKQGIELPERRATKKKLVEDYLTRLLESGEISQEALIKLSYADLKDVEELASVGKTTVTTALTEFKLNNDPEAFELGVLDFLAQERSSLVQEKTEKVEVNSVVVKEVRLETKPPILPLKNELNPDHVLTLKQMISEFQTSKISEEEVKAYELRELKHALHFVGINPSKIVRLYWEDISRDFMNRKILSGKSAAASQLQVSSSV